LSRIITTAGRSAGPAPASARKEAIATIRSALRKQTATDAEVDDALEALVELARTPED
jgi:hypothetical protein